MHANQTPTPRAPTVARNHDNFFFDDKCRTRWDVTKAKGCWFSLSNQKECALPPGKKFSPSRNWRSLCASTSSTVSLVRPLRMIEHRFRPMPSNAKSGTFHVASSPKTRGESLIVRTILSSFKLHSSSRTFQHKHSHFWSYPSFPLFAFVRLSLPAV